MDSYYRVSVDSSADDVTNDSAFRMISIKYI